MKLINIPIAIQLVIDDVGWWSGKDSNKQNGPYRTGIKRRHSLLDYEAIIEIGQRTNMRPQAAMILCEWDRFNILKDLPSATWMGKNWDNSKNISPEQNKVTDLFRNNSEHIEHTLHGIGHEYWKDGKMSRAEWYDQNNNMRPVKDVKAHLKYYKKLIKQNNLGKFPESFVPAAFKYKFGSGKKGLAPILSDLGIKYISTPFSVMSKQSEPVDRLFGVESGIITVDRGSCGYKWDECGIDPKNEIPGPICGIHWPNILHENPERNKETVDKWVKYLSAYNKRFERMLAKNTAESFSQLIYNRLTTLNKKADIVEFNFQKIDGLNAKGLLDSFYIKTKKEYKIKPDNNLKIELINNEEFSLYKIKRMNKKSKCSIQVTSKKI